ncbi:transmembrane channel-like protein 7 [Aplochiton taeniatus]
MTSELQRHESTLSGNGYQGSRQSFRLRRVPSGVGQNQTAPHFQWGSGPSEADEEGESEVLKLKERPLPMGLKRAVRQVQQMQVPVVTSWQSWQRNNAKSLLRFRANAWEAMSYIAPWRKSLHKIGGNFGGGVQSYFLFLRFLVVLNFLSFLLIAGFVLIPSIVFKSIGNTTVNSTGPKQCMAYNPNPEGLVVFYTYFLDLLSGTGFMAYSYLFYGYYSNTVAESSGFSYNLPLAYLLTAVFYFAFCLICMIARMGIAARLVVATGHSAVGSYSKIVFTGWDYGCLGDRATRLKQKNLHYKLQMDLEEERIQKKTESLTLGQTIGLYSTRVVLSLVSNGLTGAALYGIFIATELSQKNSGDAGILGLIWEYLPSIAITVGNFVVPFLNDQIALPERYSPSTTIIVALLRSVVLRMVSLGVLLFTLWSQITCNGDVQADTCRHCYYNYDAYPCWETRVGQEMYKLTLFDLLITIAVLVFVEFPRRMVVDNFSCKPVQWVGRQEFLVPANVLGLVYGQTVVWTGALFCPLLPVINTLKFVIIFYCKKATLFYNCRPAVKTFRSTTSTFFFLVVLMFGWGLALVAMIYSVAEIHPSMSCGPFRSFSTMWKIVPTTFSTLSQSTQDFLFYIGSQAFSIPLFIFSFVGLCYVAALASVYGKSVALLKHQLKLEGRDKQFLVKQIEKLSPKTGIPKDQREAWE